MPSKMRAIRLDAVGPPENLRLVEADRPQLAEDGVLIRVSYAGVLYSDAEARQGTYYRKSPLPWFPGREAAGIVEAVGAAVTHWKPGDRVAALVMGGGCYAEYVQARTQAYTTPAGDPGKPSDIIALPDHVSFTQGLVYLVNYRLAHLAFHAWGATPRGACIVVHGAAGGMGAMLMEIARENECLIAAIVRGAAESAFCRSLGAALIIDTARENYVDRLLASEFAGRITHIFNGVGGETINTDPLVLAPLGQLICYGYVAGKPPMDFFAIDRTLAVKTFNADNFLATPHFAAATQAMARRFDQGALIDVGSVYPLAEAAGAHRALHAGAFLGKIALCA